MRHGVGLLRWVGALAAVGCLFLATACSSVVPPDQFFGDARANAEGTNASTTGVPGAFAPGGATNSAGVPIGGASSLGADVPGGGSNGSGAPAATAGVQAGNCAGLHDTTGINDSTITVANVADLSGPVPGLFTAAQQAAYAYAAYFNSTSTICGRRLKLATYDSQTSSAGDQQASLAACGSSFAMVGSMGAFDAGGAQTVTNCGIPDLRAIPTSPERTPAPVVFGTDAAAPDLTPTSQYDLIKRETGSAYLKSAMLYLNAGSSVPNALGYEQAMQDVGYHFVVKPIPIDVTDFNYSTYATTLKNAGAQLVQFEGTAIYAVRLMQAMQTQNLHPVFIMDSVAYDPVFVADAGHTLDGMYSYIDTAMFEEASRTPELQLYLTWLHRVAPNAQPSFFGIFAWGAMRLFTDLAVQLGGSLSRQSLIAALRDVHAYSDNGLFAPQDVGNKRTTPCEALIQLTSSGWVRRSPYPWTCETVVKTD